jgi:hypothetical protein
MLVISDTGKQAIGTETRRACYGGLASVAAAHCFDTSECSDVKDHQHLEHATDHKCRGDEQYFLDKGEGARPTPGRVGHRIQSFPSKP